MRANRRLPPKPLVLIVLDGWGYREELDNNAIAAAHKPTWDKLWREYPHTLIHASEAHVGLPDDQMGNSEVGHLNLGAGRVVYQEYTRVSKAISDGDFYTNPTLVTAVDKAVRTNGAVHVMGLLSPGGVHSHEDHIFAMIELAAQRGAQKIYLHGFLDGRDMPPQSAEPSIRKAEALFARLGRGRIASLVGRLYAMDRDKRWVRVQSAYDLLTQGLAEFCAATALEGLKAAYARGENDEFVKATAIVAPNQEPVRIEDGDSVIFMNFRADRARQLTRAFIDDSFDGFTRAVRPKLAAYVCLTQYEASLAAAIAFPPDSLQNTLGEYLAKLGKKQLRIAETEKYAHVTFFFNGGMETPFPGEDRILVPSPKDVATYDQKPEMSAPEVTDKIVAAIQEDKYDVIICNFANADMVGHSGNFDAAKHAIEALDTCLGRILDALIPVGGEMLITSDHGNAEQMFDPNTGQPHTAHTTELVPFVYVGRPATLAEPGVGALEDIAPTMLTLLGLPVPAEMTGQVLVTITSDTTAVGQRA
jgi:2,3-bisphosphoglycerate-independent phosphoglycerate mutase